MKGKNEQHPFLPTKKGFVFGQLVLVSLSFLGSFLVTGKLLYDWKHEYSEPKRGKYKVRKRRKIMRRNRHQNPMICGKYEATDFFAISAAISFSSSEFFWMIAAVLHWLKYYTDSIILVIIGNALGTCALMCVLVTMIQWLHIFDDTMLKVRDVWFQRYTVAITVTIVSLVGWHTSYAIIAVKMTQTGKEAPDLFRHILLALWISTLLLYSAVVCTLVAKFSRSLIKLVSIQTPVGMFQPTLSPTSSPALSVANHSGSKSMSTLTANTSGNQSHSVIFGSDLMSNTKSLSSLPPSSKRSASVPATSPEVLAAVAAMNPESIDLNADSDCTNCEAKNVTFQRLSSSSTISTKNSFSQQQVSKKDSQFESIESKNTSSNLQVIPERTVSPPTLGNLSSSISVSNFELSQQKFLRLAAKQVILVVSMVVVLTFATLGMIIASLLREKRTVTILIGWALLHQSSVTAPMILYMTFTFGRPWYRELCGKCDRQIGRQHAREALRLSLTDSLSARLSFHTSQG